MLNSALSACPFTLASGEFGFAHHRFSGCRCTRGSSSSRRGRRCSARRRRCRRGRGQGVSRRQRWRNIALAASISALLLVLLLVLLLITRRASTTIRGGGRREEQRCIVWAVHRLCTRRSVLSGDAFGAAFVLPRVQVTSNQAAVADVNACSHASKVNNTNRENVLWMRKKTDSQ
jgi:hypothetical protein